VPLLNFGVKDSIKGIFKINKKYQDQKYKFFALNLLSGGTAGCITMAIMYPLSYTRVRMGVDVGTTESTREFTNLRH
jgi:solute carrier family 25 (adenine nucleotide translocator) protein 4/5/6/31